MSSPVGRKLQLKKSKVTTVSDELLRSVVGGTLDIQNYGTGYDMAGQSSPTATTTPTLTPCACPGNSQQAPYNCDTNATCSPTQCITCATVCTCIGVCAP